MNHDSKQRIEEAKSRTTKEVLVLAVLGSCWAFHYRDEYGNWLIGAMLWEL